MQRSDEPGKVRFALLQHWKGHSNNHESDWSTNSFEGLDLSVKAKHEVKFTIRRDAGRFECEGYVEDSEGAGVFHFFPDGKYATSMSALGFSVDPDKIFAMAIFDVSVDFAQEMKNLKLRNLDSDKLIAFRIFGVDAKFIQEAGNAANEQLFKKQEGDGHKNVRQVWDYYLKARQRHEAERKKK